MSVAPGPSITRDLYSAQIKVTAEPIKVKDGVAALTVDYELVGSMGEAYGSSGVSLFSALSRGAFSLGPTKINLVDLSNRQYFFQLRRADSTSVIDASAFVKLDGDTYAWNTINDKHPKAASVSLFEAPDGALIDVYVGNFGLIQDVPIVMADNTSEIAVAAPKGFNPDIKGKYSAPLRTVQIAYSEQIVSKEENDTVTIAVDSDVLFDTGKYDLSPAAQAVLDSAVAQVKASAPQGEVQVIGHTDDVGTDDYNQTLSEQRAQTVAAALTTALGSGYTVTAKGVGKAQPAVNGTDAAARAANRRVEIIFHGRLMSQTGSAQSAPVSGIPDTDAPTTSGAGQWVEYKTYSGANTDILPDEYKVKAATFAIMADSVTRTHGVLVATLDLKVTDPGAYNVELLNSLNSSAGKNDLAKRGYSAIGQMIGAYEIALLTNEGRVYPLDYAVPEVRLDALTAPAGMLSDTNIYFPYYLSGEGIGKPAHVTVIWPDTGQDKVDIELPGAFRITDVPVSEG